MRKLALMGFSVVTLFAMSAPVEYVEGLKQYLHNHTFKVNGKFYMYDFNHDGVIARNDWLYIDTTTGRVFRLMGREPTQADAFGWQPLDSIPRDLDVTHPSGYFIFIDYPKDKELFGTNAFSWLYVAKGSTFKLMGADENHNFDYLDENGDGIPDPLSGISYRFEGLELLFIYNGVLSTPSQALQQQPKETIKCEDEDSFTYDDIGYYYKVDSWYRGDIQYNCKKDAKYLWTLAIDSITIDQIIKKMEGKIVIDGKIISGVETFNYKEGSIHHQGEYEGKKFDCYDYYIPFLPVTISKYEHDKLENVMEWSGSGPCDPNFLRTTCPEWYYGSLEDCGLDGTPTYNDKIEEEIKNSIHTESNVTTTWKVTDSDGKLHEVYRHEYYRIDR